MKRKRGSKGLAENLTLGSQASTAREMCGICGLRIGWAVGEPCRPCAERLGFTPLEMNRSKWRRPASV